MGLLDDFAAALPNFLPDDPQKREAAKMGLINFGAQMLANANHGFGSALGSGLAGGTQGYNNQLEQQQKMALQSQQAKTLGLDYDIKKLAVDKQKQLTDAYKQFYGQQQATSSAPAMSVAPAAPSVPLDNPAFPRQAMPAWMPQAQVQPAAQTSAQPAGASATPSMANDNYLRHLQFAQYLDKQGLGEEAQKYYDLADKFKPKIKDQKTLLQNGKPVNVITYDDGRQEVSAFGAMPDVQILNLGGKQVVVDKNTAKDGQTFINTMTPGEKASNALGWANHRQTRELADRPQIIQTEAGPMLVSPRSGVGSPVMVNGQPLPSKETQTKLQDAKSVLNLLDMAEPLLDKANGSYLGMGGTLAKSALGISSDAAEANAQLKVLEGGLVSRMPKMSGPQSDKDVLLYRQMAGQIGDPTVPASAKRAAIQTIRELNQKYIDDQSGASSSSEPTMKMPKSKMFKLDGGGSVGAKLGTDGNYYVERNGKKYRVAE